MAQISNTIFRGNDIRGEDGKDLNKDTFYNLGIAYGSFLFENDVKDVVVGYDGRENSEEYSSILIDGLKDAGMKVLSLGMVPTPFVYWVQAKYDIKGGAVVTASHNPASWNGVKFSFDFLDGVSGDYLQDIYDSIIDDRYSKNDGGSVEEKDIKDEYFKDISSKVKIEKQMKFLLNTGNGVVGHYISDLFKELNISSVSMNKEVDSSYPKYTPNPLDENMIQDTSKHTVLEKCDGAFMFDGDGDRVGLVDENGSVVYPDVFFICLINALYEEKGDLKVVYDILSTQSIFDECEKIGVEAVCSKTGYKNIRDKMKEVSADIGCEASGHIIYNHNYYGFDDGLFASVKLAEYFSKQDQPISRIIQSIPQYISTPTKYIQVGEDRKLEMVAKISEDLRGEGYDIEDMDGVRFLMPDGWGIVRVSQTSPSIAIRAEAKTQDGLLEVEKIIDDKLSKFL